MRNGIHGLSASIKQILSLGGLNFRHTVSALSFGMFFFYMRPKTLQYNSLPHFLVTVMNFVPYGGKKPIVQVEETSLLRFVMGRACLSKVRNETHKRQASVYIDMLTEYTDKLIVTFM